ncbi:hypothetical protein [Mycobacterium parascrofulaceum]|uniref:hypothetical protein n=1 Tax=Mycobacterium parascrofulaceum TaxID=240125 RepID=UPI00058C381E|nr:MULTISPECIES: hypothetical protein [Mycobacterium]
MPDGAAAPIARRTRTRGAARRAGSWRRVAGQALIAASVAALIAAPDSPPQLPPGCAIGWTMVGHVLIYVPDCTHRSPSPQPPPEGPPPGPGPQPGQ